MLYLNSIENVEASPTEEKYAISHDEVPSMLNIPELAPSRELLTQWQSNTIDWEEFRERFTDEMRAEYRKEESRLKGLIKYSLENDVTLHSPEPSGEQTYRAILEGIINVIVKSQGQTGHVTNLTPEPVEETPPQEDITNLFGNALHELNLTKAENTRLLIENAELKKDIQSFQTENHNKGKNNDELKKRIDQLKGEINTYTENIKSLEEKISYKEGEIRLLTDSTRKRGKLNTELKTQIDQLQEETSNHGRIRDIAVEATQNDLAAREFFRTLSIDENRPETLIETLRNWLKNCLKTGPKDLRDLPELIKEHRDYGKFDQSDSDLAHVIRTQRNLVVFNNEKIDERTIMARVLCCFFAAALLSSKLPKPKQPAFK